MKKSLIILLLFLFSMSVFGDRLYLKNGDVIKGKIIKYGRKHIIIKTEFGNISYSKEKVSNIKYEVDLRLSSLWRSLVVPSWGQFYQDKPLKGWIIASTMTLFAASAIYAGLKFSDYRNQYDSLTYDDEAIRGKMNNWRSAYNVFLIAAITGWILNAADAYIFGPKTESDQIQKTAFIPRIEKNFIGISFSHNF